MKTTIHADIDSSGRFIGFYPSDVWDVNSLPPDAVEITIEVWRSALASPGGTYADGVYTPLPPTAPKVVLAAYAADKRWRVETGGIVVAGSQIDTSRDSQSLIEGAFAYVKESGEDAVEFKTASGWVTMDAATVRAVALAVGAHVRACFATESAVSTAILAGTITTEAEIDSAAWPA